MKLADNDSSSSDALLSEYGGIANLAGINLPSSSRDKGPYVLSTMRSKEFLKHLMTFNSVTENLIAVKTYNSNTGKILYDPDLYDSETNEWKRKPKGMLTSKPSHIEVSEFYNKSFNAWQDEKSGFIYISFSHQSPFFSYDFLKLIISEVNSELRLKDLKDSNESLEYLHTMLNKTSDTDLRKSISNLIESQIKVQMLANIRDDYAFSAIDEPFLPEDKSSPNRILIVLTGLLFGFFAGIFIVASKFILTKNK